VILKDNGIKARIIKQYIPVINKLINKYLSAMDFFVQFELNENFDETIKSRFRDEFSYASFSEGEKMRINLAILFTWRAIAKLRNSASTNLLIMDEVLDGSLDSNGTDEFLKILNNLTQDTNTFIISHKVDQLVDKFSNVIKFAKIKNFSQVAA
jgi:ABC-type multidrug transport system ATPase subunit